MVTNPLLNNFECSMEQEMIHSLVAESIRNYGHDVYYIPKNLNNYDGIYGEDDISDFSDAYLVEMYIKNVSGFGGQGSFMSKFGLEIRDQINFVIAKRTFDNEIGKKIQQLKRPREGDLIFFPLNRKLFEIKFTDPFQMFYNLGILPMFDMQCELFEYSSEVFRTGIGEIDSIQQHSMNIFDYSIVTSEGFALSTTSNNYIITNEFDDNINLLDPLADNFRIEEESGKNTANSLIKWTETNPFQESKW